MGLEETPMSFQGSPPFSGCNQAHETDDQSRQSGRPLRICIFMAMGRNLQVQSSETRKRRGWMHGILATSKWKTGECRGTGHVLGCVSDSGEPREITCGLPHSCSSLRSALQLIHKGWSQLQSQSISFQGQRRLQ